MPVDVITAAIAVQVKAHVATAGVPAILRVDYLGRCGSGGGDGGGVVERRRQ